MKVIWKHKILGPDYEFDAPSGAVAREVRVEFMIDGQQPVLYLLCDRMAGPAKHQLRMFATGATIPDDSGEWIGTISLRNPDSKAMNVVHIFHKQLSLVMPS